MYLSHGGLPQGWIYGTMLLKHSPDLIMLEVFYPLFDVMNRMLHMK